MVLRYTRTRSVDTKPVVSDSRRGGRTSRVSLGEDCNRVTMCLRPCLLVGCIRRLFAGVHPGVVGEPAAGITGPAPCSAVRCGTPGTTASTGFRVPQEPGSQETHRQCVPSRLLTRRSCRSTWYLPAY